jgi:hypothetical protein
MGHLERFPPERASGRCQIGQGTSAGGCSGDGLAPIPDADKGGLWLANSTPIADPRRDEDITAMCRKPIMSELSFIRRLSRTAALGS